MYENRDLIKCWEDVPMLKINNLRKSFNTFKALDGLYMEIQKGELFGFVGPNGSGKTTTMKIIAGLLIPDSGTVLINGIDIREDKNAVKGKIGYMPDFFGVYDNLKVIEYMEFYASIYGIIGREATKLSYGLLDLVSLSDKGGEYVDGLSRGMKQRLCLARCLVHNPQLLLLDEPAAGLDPRARVEMKNVLKNLQQEGRSILISSHILTELVEICSHIGIIEHGKIAISGLVSDIMSSAKSVNPIVMRCLEGYESAVKVLKENEKVENVSIKENSIYIAFKGGAEDEAKLLMQLIASGAKISSFTREEGNLESLFMQITEQDK